MAAQPWLYGFGFGIRQAQVVTPEQAARLIAQAQNPIMVVGSECEIKLPSGARIVDYALEIAKMKNMPIIATTSIVKELREVYNNVRLMYIMELFQRLIDPNWNLNGRPHDLVILMGHLYYMIAHVLTATRHFAKHLKTLSLEIYYHPNVNFSLQNQPLLNVYENTLKKIITTLRSLIEQQEK
jgi:CO dehydrogenase/acetyl-CoA synthase complex epsilon subunit